MLKTGLILTLCAVALGACASHGGGPGAPYAPSPDRVTPPPPPIEAIRPKV
jgi:hypothetical protein